VTHPSRPVRAHVWAFARGAVAALVCLGAIAFLTQGCNNGVVGVDACKAIEKERCVQAKTCFDPVWTDQDVKSCQLLYEDQCLRGIENTDIVPSDDDTDACVAAVQALGACAVAGTLQAGDCAEVGLEMGAAVLTPCDILQNKVEMLTACAWAAKAPS